MPATLDPDALYLGLGVEVVTLDDDEVGQFSGLDSAELILNACELGRRGGQRGKCIALGQATLDRLGDVFAEQFFVLQPVRGQGDLEAALMQQCWVFRCPVPGAQLLKIDLVPVGVAWHVGRLGEIHRHDEPRASGFHEVASPPFVSGRDDDWPNAELTAESHRLVDHQHAARLDDNRLPVFQNGLEGI